MEPRNIIVERSRAWALKKWVKSQTKNISNLKISKLKKNYLQNLKLTSYLLDNVPNLPNLKTSKHEFFNLKITKSQITVLLFNKIKK